MKKSHKNEKTPSIKEQLESLENLQDNEIDLSDISEIDFSEAERGHFYRPDKKPNNTPN